MALFDVQPSAHMFFFVETHQLIEVLLISHLHEGQSLAPSLDLDQLDIDHLDALVSEELFDVFLSSLVRQTRHFPFEHLLFLLLFLLIFTLILLHSFLVHFFFFFTHVRHFFLFIFTLVHTLIFNFFLFRFTLNFLLNFLPH